MGRESTRRRLASLGFASAAFVTAALGPAVAGAQTPSTGVKAEPPAKSEVRAATTDASAVASGPSNQGPAPWQKLGLNGAMRLDFHGSGSVDAGFVKYTFPDNTLVQGSDSFYDLRGRFVLGADLDYEFAPKYFFHARGQFVAWVREAGNTYQGNADDVYVQAGQRDVWDVQLGRFLTWRVFRKGLGFDLYTLEDTGPLENAHWDVSALFAPHIYEVSEIFLRTTQGRLAIHVYPTSWSGIEVVGEYGRPDATYDTVGGRAAGNITYGPVSVSLAAEAKRWIPAAEDPPHQACPTCSIKNHSGYGGGAVLDFHVVELGANFARARLTKFLDDPLTGGTVDPAQSSTTNSFGGYLEVDPGTLAFQRRLVIGVGWDRSEFLFQDSLFKRHTQAAAYIAYPLGFNDAIVKLVGTQADYVIDTPVPGMPGLLTENLNHLYAVSLRTSIRF